MTLGCTVVTHYILDATLIFFSATTVPSIICVCCFMIGFRDNYHANGKKR